MSDVNWSNANNKTLLFSFEGRQCLGKVVDVYDGDTVKIVFPLSDKEPDRLYKWNCRLINIDTPELRSKNIKEKEYGKLVKDKLCEKILNKLVFIKCSDFDKYGRLLVEIFENSNSEQSINNWLIENKYAKEYNGETKSKWFIDE